MRSWLLAALLAILAALPAAAMSPYPHFTGKRLYLSEARDAGYGAAASAARRAERSGFETYYLVVVRSSGAGDSATRDYTDALYQWWSDDARRSGIRLDPDRHVIIVLALENRQISVHAGSYLQNILGFTGDTIDEQVVRPVFIPHARAGDMARGLAALVQETHRWLHNAETHWQQDLRLSRETVRRARARAAHGMRAERAALLGLRAGVLRAGRAGLSVRPLSAEVARLLGLLDRAARRPDLPGLATELTAKARTGRLAVADRLAGLGAEKAAVEGTHAEAVSRLAEAHEAVAGAGGVAVADLVPRVRQAEEALRRGDRLRSLDYTAAASSLRQSLEHSSAVVGKVRRRAELLAQEQHRRYLLTHVLPLSAGSVLLLALTILLICLRVRHLRLLRVVAKQFSEQLGVLTDLLEPLERHTERHKHLTDLDQDFVAPITGRTLEHYQATDRALAETWAIWSETVTAREEIEGLIAAESGLGVRRLRQAQQRLAALNRGDDLKTRLAAVDARLNRLYSAHEDAGDRLEALAAQRAAIAERLAGLRSLSLPTAPYAEAVLHVEGRATDAHGLRTADPLGAQETADAGLQAAGELAAWIDRVRAQADRQRDLVARAASLAGSAAARRSEGYLLKEPTGDPDPLLAHAREDADGGWQRLLEGDDAGAVLRLDQATSFGDRAGAVIEGQVKARAFCSADLPARRAETDRLARRLAEARTAEGLLGVEFDPDCWAAVRSHCDGAEGDLPAFRRTADEAEVLAHPEKQHYFHASALLEGLAKGQGETEARLAAVEKTLERLRSLRAETQAAIPQAGGSIETLAAYMEANRHAVRRPAHDALSAARKALESGRAGTEAPAPHWVRVAGWVREARTGSQAGLAHAREDVAAYEHLLQAVADSERRYAAAEEYIRRETADRPAAACRLAGAGAILTDVRSKVEIAGNDWARLAAEAERVATTADEALQMAQEDVRLAETAAGAIASAQSGISSADRYYAHGVRADVGSAQMLLSQAVASLSDKVYEDAIELALHARSHAEDAVAQAQARVAVVEAALERQRREEERRREEEERRQALFNSLSSSGSSSSSSPSSRGSGSSSSSFSSGSSSSSYKSGTSQSSW